MWLTLFQSLFSEIFLLLAVCNCEGDRFASPRSVGLHQNIWQRSGGEKAGVTAMPPEAWWHLHQTCRAPYFHQPARANRGLWVVGAALLSLHINDRREEATSYSPGYLTTWVVVRGMVYMCVCGWGGWVGWRTRLETMLLLKPLKWFVSSYQWKSAANFFFFLGGAEIVGPPLFFFFLMLQ